MKLKTKPRQVRKIHRLVRSSCANCDEDNCLLFDDGETHRCAQLLSFYSVCCKYFLECVLPGSKKLYNQILKQNGKDD